MLISSKMKTASKDYPLLSDYICSRVRKYREPERAGVPKGEPVGFSAVKLKTALLHLASISGIEIAEMCGVPYGGFRVWRTNRDYKKLIQLHIREFSQLYVARLADFIKASTSQPRTVTKDGLVPASVVFSLQDLSSFSETIVFSDALMKEIVSALKAVRFEKDQARALLERSFTLNGLSLFFKLRKGIILADDRGAMFYAPGVMQEASPGLLEPKAIIELAELAKEPWDAPRQAVREALARFTKKVGLCP
jgi:hypothetical protein